MPVSKKSRDFHHKWSDFVASEFGIPTESVWVLNMTGARTLVYIWVEKLGPGDYERLSSFKSGGGHMSTRGKLSRFLEDLNADGWFSRGKPSDAGPGDLFVITPNAGDLRVFCTGCNEEMFSIDDVHLQKCKQCAKMAKI